MATGLTPLLDCETPLMRVNRHWAMLAKMARGPAALILSAVFFNLTLNAWLSLYYQLIATPQGWLVSSYMEAP